VPSDTAGRLALLQETGLIDDRTAPLSARCSMTPAFARAGAIAHDVAQRIGIPAAAPKDRLLPSGTGITGRRGPHPPRLTPLLPRQSIRNRPADAATRSCVNKGHTASSISHSDEACSSGIASIGAPLIHALPTTREKRRAPHQKRNRRASLSYGSSGKPGDPYADPVPDRAISL
jgi:hypothetical protein